MASEKSDSSGLFGEHPFAGTPEMKTGGLLYFDDLWRTSSPVSDLLLHSLDMKEAERDLDRLDDVTLAARVDFLLLNTLSEHRILALASFANAYQRRGNIQEAARLRQMIASGPPLFYDQDDWKRFHQPHSAALTDRLVRIPLPGPKSDS